MGNYGGYGAISAPGGRANAVPIVAVANYAALPAANTVSGKYYFCIASQGTAWLPGSLGGTYYPSGTYYSDGNTWIYGITPYQVGQSGVDAGVITDQFVSPATLNNYSGWNKTKVGLGNVDNTSDADKPISTATAAALAAKQSQLDELKFELQSNSITKYKEYIYTGANLTRINVWETSAMLLKLYQVDFTYFGINLTTKIVTRISDSFTATTVYTYSGVNLVSADTT